MPVLGTLSLTLEVPSLAEGVAFYSDAGLTAASDGSVARVSCSGQKRDSIVLIGGAGRKRLHHITLRAEGLAEIRKRTLAAGGTISDAPRGHPSDGLWVRDPHGVLYHLVERRADPKLPQAARFEINAPGRIVRKRRSAVRPSASYPPVKPQRLGHIVTFSPDVPRSARFAVEALGLGLTDSSEDLVAFCCARKNSDHHILAFAKSADVGFHHASFQVSDPDEVGRGGRTLAQKAGRGDWGFGRHTIGSNFFHYVQDPWGSWFEYYSDMDFIDDYSRWSPTNYPPADSLVSWGPALPDDFSRNYEVG